MATPQPKPELLVIVGPTASGKSALAMKVAQKYQGEIIAADSRTVYKKANIGTSKPTLTERKKVPHWGLDLIEPGEHFSAKAFKDYALNKIAEIRSRGHLPILVGGTGLYIDSILFGFNFGSQASPALRHRLEAKTVKQLQDTIAKKGYRMPENKLNKRYLIRTIETKGAHPGIGRPLPNYLAVGLRPDKDAHRKKIAARAESMFSSGVVEEAKNLERAYGREAAAGGGIIYKICQDLVDQKISRSEAIDLFKTRDWQYSRRQLTWFKRNKKILWLPSTDEAEAFIDQAMNT